jgi:hypothetical protein
MVLSVYPRLLFRAAAANVEAGLDWDSSALSSAVCKPFFLRHCTRDRNTSGAALLDQFSQVSEQLASSFAMIHRTERTVSLLGVPCFSSVSSTIEVLRSEVLRAIQI